MPRALRFIERIENADGEVVYRSPMPEGEAGSRRACDEACAYQIHSMLQDTTRDGNLAAEGKQLIEQPFHGAVKTGTTDSFSDGWCVGYNGAATLGIWVPFHQGRNRSIADQAFGRELAFSPWRDVMNQAREHYPGHQLEVPSELDTVTVCGKSGLMATRYCYEPAHGSGIGENLRYMGYREFLRGDRAKLGLCDVHGRGGIGTDQILAEYGPEGGNGGRSSMVTVSPIHPKAPALLGTDPYDSEVVALAPEDEEVDRFVRGEGLSVDFIVQGEEEAELHLGRPRKIVIEMD